MSAEIPGAQKSTAGENFPLRLRHNSITIRNCCRYTVRLYA